MIELIRNCSHGNQIATYLAEDNEPGKLILKVTTAFSGIQALKREYKGWDWYQSLRYPEAEHPFCKIIRDKASYIKLQIKYIEGIIPDHRKGLINNAWVSDKVIEHYCRIWPYFKDRRVPLHGDLSIGNIIYNPAFGVNIIDWEYFNFDGAFWGFDALHFLFELLWLSMRNRKLPTKDEVDIITRNIRLLNTSGWLDAKIIKHPLLFVRNFMRENTKIWTEQIKLSPDKFPILNFTDFQISAIDNIIEAKFK